MKIHIIGIGGVSTSALAQILVHQGHTVSGSDKVKTHLTNILEQKGIRVFYKHSKQNICGQDLVVFSAAIKEDNEELQEAKKQGIKIVTRAELLGKIASEYQKVISVAGTHGKTTTTGMLASIFLAAGKNPTVHIGGELPIIGGNIKVGSKKYFITEACEYYDSFLTLSSDYSIVLNVEKDHMDYFKTISNLQNSFKKFAKNTKQTGTVVANIDDVFARSLQPSVQKISYSIKDSSADIFASCIGEIGQKYFYNLVAFGKNLGKIQLSIEGKHNIYNSLAAIAVALAEGIDFSHISLALSTYQSSGRRFQKLAQVGGAAVIHDYAHHPTEISASIAAARGITTGKLIVAFEPHTFSRTQYLWNEFTKCFSGADKLILLPIYPAREKPIDGITSLELSLHVVDTNCTYAQNFDDAYKLLKEYDIKNNTILILGAGTILELTKYFE